MDVRFSRSATIFLNSQSITTRSKLLGDCVDLSNNPWLSPDNASIASILTPPGVMRLFRDDSHWIIFYLNHTPEQTIIANIGDNSEKPFLWRPEPK